MSIFFVNTQDAQISNAFLATLGAAPGSTYLAQVKTFGLVPSVQAMINATGSSTAAALSTKVATNLGLTGSALTGGTAYLSSVTFAGSSSAWAANLMETLNLFSTLQSDATYGSAATAYLARVNSAVSYSSVAGNNSTDLSTLAAAVGSAGSTGSGSTFTLTTSEAGARTGTALNDTFIALDNALTQYVVDGGAGVDSLRATISANDSYDVSNVEIVDFKVTAIATINMSDFSGEESVGVSGSADTVLSNFKDGVVLRSSQTGTATLTANVASGVEAISVTLNAATSTGLMTIDDVVTVSVTGTDDDDSISLDGDAVETLNLLGSTDMTVVTPVGAELTTIDASAMTGDLTLGVTANDVAVTTGSGDDTVTFAANTLTDEDSVDLGDGNDTLVLTAATNVFANVAAGETLSVTGVETLSLVVGAANDAIDFDIFASPTQFTTVLVTSTLDAANITLTDIQTTNVSIRNTNNANVSDTINAVTYDLKDSSGTADSVTFNLTNRDTDQDFTITTLTAAGIESMTINTVGGADGDITITTLTATSLESVVISGNADLTLGAFANTVETVDGSASTGDLSLTFAGGDVTVTGGSGDDTFVFAATLDEDDTIDGGDGIDTLSVTALGATAIDMVLEATNVEVLTFVEDKTSKEAVTLDFRNATSFNEFNITFEETDDHLLTLENVASGALEVNILGVGEANGDTLVIQRDRDSSADSIQINLTADNGEAVFEGTITVNDEETIVIDTTGLEAKSAVTLADLDASDATSVTFTNDDTFDADDIFVLTLNSIKSGATIDFTGYNQSIGNAVAFADVAGAAKAADTTGAVADLATIMGTAGFTAVATGRYTFLLGDGRTEDADVETVINLGTSNTGADVIRFVNSSADATNDIGVVVINNFNVAANTVVTNRSVIDLSAFGIEGITELTLAAGEALDGADLTVISAATATDFAGTITLLGVAATSLEASDFIFA